MFDDVETTSLLGEHIVSGVRGDLSNNWQKENPKTEADLRSAITRANKLMFDFCTLCNLKQGEKAEPDERYL
jgi:hypothetical protein